MEQIKLTLSIDEANTVLEALGQMPYKSVYQLVSNIQQQAGQQMKKNGNGEEKQETTPKKTKEKTE